MPLGGTVPLSGPAAEGGARCCCQGLCCSVVRVSPGGAELPADHATSRLLLKVPLPPSASSYRLLAWGSAAQPPRPLPWGAMVRLPALLAAQCLPAVVAEHWALEPPLMPLPHPLEPPLMRRSSRSCRCGAVTQSRLPHSQALPYAVAQGRPWRPARDVWLPPTSCRPHAKGGAAPDSGWP